MEKEYNLNNLTASDLAEILNALDDKTQISAQDIENAISSGCPLNADGTLSIYTYAAWLCGSSE